MSPLSSVVILICSVCGDLFSWLESASPALATVRVQNSTKAWDTAAEYRRVSASLPIAVLFIADGYPNVPVSLSTSDWSQARQLNTSLLIEFPSTLPRWSVTGHFERIWQQRLVAPTDVAERFGLPYLSILDPQTTYGASASAAANAPFRQSSILSFARIAGTRTAVFGLPPQSEMEPAVFVYSCAHHINSALSGGKFACPANPPTSLSYGTAVLVAATPLSVMFRQRAAPSVHLWGLLTASLTFLLGTEGSTALAGLPPVKLFFPVGPALGPTDVVTQTAMTSSIARGTKFLARFVVTNSTSGLMYETEGVGNAIYPNGSQVNQTVSRLDCSGEAAGTLGLAGTAPQRAIASGLATYVLSIQHKDPANVEYGLIDWGWGTAGWECVFYGDDNARLFHGMLIAAASLERSDVADGMLALVLANLRTTGPNGFRLPRIDCSGSNGLYAKGWEYFFSTPAPASTPHYVAEMWASYYLAGSLSGISLFTTLADRGLGALASQFPRWAWTEYATEEWTRAAHAASWATRAALDAGAEPTMVPFLSQLVSYLATRFRAGGGLSDMLGASVDGCQACPPRSNKAYGTGEGACISDNEDDIADLLYTNNFLLRSLTESEAALRLANATGAAKTAASLANQLADFLVRTQATSTSSVTALVDGGWFRGFDLRGWEVFGAANDWGWGPFSITTGWSTTWITMSLHLHLQQTNLWDYLKTSKTVSTAFSPSKARGVCATFLPTKYCH